jgi:hypothetical protein
MLHGIGVRHVGRHGHGPTAASVDRFDRGDQFVFGPRGYDRRRAGVSQRQGDGPPDTAAAASHNGDLAGKFTARRISGVTHRSFLLRQALRLRSVG